MNEVAEAWLKVAEKANRLKYCLELIGEQAERQEKKWHKTAEEIREG